MEIIDIDAEGTVHILFEEAFESLTKELITKGLNLT